mgnify:CR=1 FL=1
MQGGEPKTVQTGTARLASTVSVLLETTIFIHGGRRRKRLPASNGTPRTNPVQSAPFFQPPTIHVESRPDYYSLHGAGRLHANVARYRPN